MKTNINLNDIVVTQCFNSLTEYRPSVNEHMIEPYQEGTPIERVYNNAPKTLAYIPIHIETESEFDRIPVLTTPFIRNGVPHGVIDFAEVFAIVESLASNPDKPEIATYEMTFPLCGTPVSLDGEPVPVGETVINIYTGHDFFRVWLTANVEDYEIVSDIISINRYVKYVWDKAGLMFPQDKIDSPFEREDKTILELPEVSHTITSLLDNATAVLVDEEALTFPVYDEDTDSYKFAWITQDGDNVSFTVSVEKLGYATFLNPNTGVFRIRDDKNEVRVIQLLTGKSI